MFRRTALILIAALATGPATAQSFKRKAHEVAALLTGNTAVGAWEGIKYCQFFASDGSTIYAQENTRSTRGDWHIDQSKDEYQSI